MNNNIIISEHGVNRHFVPMSLKKSENDLIIYDKKGIPITCVRKNSIWDIYCYKTIDYITSLIRKEFEIWCKKSKFTNYKIIRNSKHKSIHKITPIIKEPYLKNIKDIIEDHQLYNISYIFSFDEALKSPIFKGLKKIQLIYILNKISEYFIKTNYSILTEDAQLNHNFRKSYSNLNGEYDRLFHVTYEKGETERKIAKLNFRTCLGACFLHNIYTSSYNIIDKKIYELSKSSHILYRMNFLINNFNVQSFELKKTCQYLNIINKNENILYTKLKSIFDELVDNKLITIIEYDRKNKFIKCRKNSQYSL